MDWMLANDATLSRYFESENVWKKHWAAIEGEFAFVEVSGKGMLSLPIWEAEFKGVVKRFAADEVSSSVWIFALPA